MGVDVRKTLGGLYLDSSKILTFRNIGFSLIYRFQVEIVVVDKVILGKSLSPQHKVAKKTKPIITINT
jgi:hypothetical protein